MNKRMILSGGMLVFMAAIVAGGTGAFFSDTETSVGNVFTAGSVSIDLLSVDHTYFGDVNDIPGDYFEVGTANNVPFFKFNDLKPGDTGMIEKELVNGANDAFFCAKNTLGDNDSPFIDKLKLRVNTGNGITAGQFYNAPFDEWYTLDTTNPTNPGGQGLAVNAGDTVIAELEYCLGDFVNGVPGAPGSAGTSCVVDTAYDWNPLQNQEIQVDVEYYAVQQRNNGNFTCGDLNTPVVNPNEETIALDTPTDFDTLQDDSLFVLGNSSWKNDDDAGDKTFFYVYGSAAPGVLGTFTVDEIESISYSTNKPTNAGDVDFYYSIYTEADGVDDTSWYGYRLNMEPYFSENLVAPANTWNVWNTESGSNESTFFDTAKTAGGFGFYGQPTLTELQAGTINWSTYNAAYTNQAIDYGAESVLAIAFNTGSGWDADLTGSIDAIIIELTNGKKLTIDLE